MDASIFCLCVLLGLGMFVWSLFSAPRKPADAVRLVKSSWKRLTEGEEFTNTFYSDLWGKHPELRKEGAMFAKTNMKSQGKMLHKTLDFVVGSCDRLETILDKVKELAIRHVGYGVDKKEHFDWVADSLLFALEKDLTPKHFWTPEVKQAWIDIYTVLSGVMWTTMQKEINAANKSVSGKKTQ